MDSVDNAKGKLFFLHRAGGCRKTHVGNALATAIHAKGDVVLCVASSAIAALLLHGGRTAHSHFKIPIPIDESSTCRITKDDNMYGVLQHTKLIIWDEAPMQHCHGPEAINRTLKDLLKDVAQDIDDVPLFAGITFMFAGNFKQTLPVIPRGSRVQIAMPLSANPFCGSISRSSISLKTCAWNSPQKAMLSLSGF
jgi:ATP-dependent DNA helicase PIF1